MINFIFRSKKRKEHSMEVIFEGLANECKKNGIAIRKSYLPNERYNSIRAIFENIRYTRKIKGDVLHITGEVYFLGSLLNKNKTIMTIHDLVMLEPSHSTGLKRWIFKKFWFEIPIKRVKYVICISEKTKEDVLKIFPGYADKIIVIPNPYGDYLKDDFKVFDYDNPRILVVGTKENKNLERIICAVNGIRCRLDIVGYLTEKQKAALTENSVEYRNYYNLTNEQIYQRYCEADLVCFPSTYEGFGMPIIEAQAVGRVVITSNIRPMCDVAGKGAVLVNPYKVEDLRGAILKVIADDSLRKELIRAGKENAKLYSMKRVSTQYLSLYEKISRM